MALISGLYECEYFGSRNLSLEDFRKQIREDRVSEISTAIINDLLSVNSSEHRRFLNWIFTVYKLFAVIILVNLSSSSSLISLSSRVFNKI